MRAAIAAIYAGAAAVLLLGAVISAAQWLLLRWYKDGGSTAPTYGGKTGEKG